MRDGWFENIMCNKVLNNRFGLSLYINGDLSVLSFYFNDLIIIQHKIWMGGLKNQVL